MLRTAARHLTTMATTTSSPFTRTVVDAVRRIYPEHLADKSFDNTGLLLEAPFNPARPQRNSVLLTIDLTTAVADEAIERKDSVVVSYHPIIFRGLKSFTLADSQQRSLLRLAAEGISVYCPHTAVDAVEGGNADWLGDIVTGEVNTTTSPASRGTEITPGYLLHQFPSSFDAQPGTLNHAHHEHTRVPIHPNSTNSNAGTGRLITLNTPRDLSSILHCLTSYLGQPSSFLLALPHSLSSSSATASAHPIRTIAICCGSGGSVFASLKEHADLWVTGELVHHETLAATERGICVVAFGHSNSERAYLGAVMRGKLEREICQKVGAGEAEVVVSKADRDPFGWVVRGG